MHRASRRSKLWVLVAVAALLCGLPAQGAVAALGHDRCRDPLGTAQSPVERKILEAAGQGRVYSPTNAASVRLTPAFLLAVLTCPDSGQRFRRGLRLKRVVLDERLDLTNATVGIPFSCRRCMLAGIRAPHSDWRGRLDLFGARIDGPLLVSGARFHASLALRDTRIKGVLDLSNGAVDGDLDGHGLAVRDAVSLANAAVRGRVRLDGAAMRQLNLRAAEVEKQVIASGIRLFESLQLDKARIGSDLLIRTYAGGPDPVIGLQHAGRTGTAAGSDQPVVLKANNARIGGRVEIAKATVHGRVLMDAIRVAEDIWIRDDTTLAGDLVLAFAEAGQNVDFSGATLRSVDLTAAEIGGEFRLGSHGSERLSAPTWAKDASLTLRNARAHSWNDAVAPARGSDLQDPWPGRFDLINFDYQGIGGLGGGGATARDDAWFLRWIARQQPHSFEPYQRLAAVLETSGRSGTAKQVLFAGKDRQTADAHGIGWIFLLFQKYLVGYGVYEWWVVFWILGISGVGYAVFRSSGQRRPNGEPIDFIYSVDQLVHFLKLRPQDEAVTFSDWRQYYHFLHRVMGWLLGTFLLGAIAGLFGT